MNKMRYISLIGILLSFTTFSQQWKIADDHKITFSNSDVSGVFKEIDGNITFDPAKLTSSKLDLSIKVESINTGNGVQNKHAKSDDWFNAEKYPEISFVSSKIEKTADGYKAAGKLKIHGISKEVSIPFTFTKKGAKGSLVAKFSVNRIDFGVGKKGNNVGETLKISATIPMVKK